MKPLVIIGDLHLNDFLDGYMEAQLRTVSNIIDDAQEILKGKEFYVVFLGDIFDKRHPKVTELLAFNNFVETTLNTSLVSEVFILRGNHDTLDRAGVETGLALINDIVLVDHPMMMLEMLLIPHYEDSSVIKNALNEKYSKVEVILGHFGYKGCITPEGETESDEITLDDFKKLTILGHIHTPKQEGNVTVLGTPYSTCFSESWKDHRFAILKDRELQFYPVRTQINHLHLMDSDLIDLKTIKLEKDAFNLVAYHPSLSSDILKVKKELRSFAKFVTIKYDSMKDAYDQHWIGALEDLSSYVDSCDTGLDREKLRGLAESVLEEMYENKENSSD